MNNGLLSLLAAFGLFALMSVCVWVGFAYGREAGRCDVACADATSNKGSAHYYGGRCGCLVGGKEFRP